MWGDMVFRELQEIGEMTFPLNFLSLMLNFTSERFQLRCFFIFVTVCGRELQLHLSTLNFHRHHHFQRL